MWGWRGTARSACPPACPGSLCTSAAGRRQPRKVTSFLALHCTALHCTALHPHRDLSPPVPGPVARAGHLVSPGALGTRDSGQDQEWQGPSLCALLTVLCPRLLCRHAGKDLPCLLSRPTAGSFSYLRSAWPSVCG